MSDVLADTEVIQGKGSKAAAPRAGTGGGRGEANKGEKLVWIKIPKTKDEVRDVFVGYDFKGYQIKRGVDVQVPEGVVHALEIAIGTTMVPTEDPVTHRITLMPQETQSVPFQVLRR